MLLLQRALPEGRRPARRDREARRRGGQGGDRPRHGREARQVVHQVDRDDGVAARDRARAEDAGRDHRDLADEVRDGPRRQGEGAAADPAARRGEGRRGARPPQARATSRAASATKASSRASTRSRSSTTTSARTRTRTRRKRREAGRVLQGLSRVALGEGARHLDPGARAESRARAARPRVGHVLRRGRHPRGGARLLPPPERAHPGVRGGDGLRHADDDLQRLHAEPQAGRLHAEGRRRAPRAREHEPRGRRRAALQRRGRGEALPLARGRR